MTKLPLCPIEGCESESDHHCHWWRKGGMVDDRSLSDAYCPCGKEDDHVSRCYSRALKPAPLMLSVETVAKLIEAAETAAEQRGFIAGFDEGINW